MKKEKNKCIPTYSDCQNIQHTDLPTYMHCTYLPECASRRAVEQYLSLAMLNFQEVGAKH